MSFDLPTHSAAAAPSADPYVRSPARSDSISGELANGPAAPPASADYVPKTILLTGGAGFIGSTVLCHLVRQYPAVNIICLDKLEYCATTANFDEIKGASNFTFIKGDICSTDLVNHIISAYGVDTVMHFAAQTHVDNSFGLALDFTRTNIFGTHVLLESCKHHANQIQRFIHVSTDEVYGESQMHSKHRLDEHATLNPSNPYAATKVAAEFLIRSYHQSFGLPTIITRGNNVYGPKQYPEKLIPKFIALLSQGRPCPLHGDGLHLRSFLYVDDVCSAFDCILRRGVPGHIYNIGSEQEVSNVEVLNKLIDKFNLTAQRDRLITFVRDRPYNDLRYYIDTKSLESLGWKRRVDFDDGLDKTIQWYLTHPNHWGNLGEEVLAAHPRVTIKVSAELE